MSAYKKALNGRGYILRVYESRGKKADFTVSIPPLGLCFSGSAGPYEIKTYRIDGNAVREENLTEQQN